MATLYDTTLLLFDANAGLFERVDGVLKYVRTAYDMGTAHNNLDGSATATVQPRLVGGIAPLSKYTASNQNGEARLFIHTLIDLSATGIWSISSMINFNGNSETNRTIASDSTGSTLLKNKTTTNVFSFTNSAGATVDGTVNNSAYIGKFTKWMFVANGTSLKIYADGTLFDTLTVSTVAKFNTLFTALSAKINYYRLQNTELTTDQITSETAFIATLYSAIESTVIGTQTWATRNFEAVCTPMGNVIPEMQTAAAVEKLDNPTITGSATGWTLGVGIAYDTDNIIATAATATATQTKTLTAGKYYKCVTVVSALTGGTANILLGGVSGANITAAGTQTIILKATAVNTTVGLNAVGLSATIDSCSISELGWANATEIYDAVYAATAGDATAKTYAALKESGMWCYYNNDAANGAIYGKLYNWYAVKLFDLDMASASFGWHVPTSTEFTTLQTALGGAVVAGGKMKMTGTDYWNTPNTGADNTSGFTGLGNGIRNAAAGVFAYTKQYGLFGCSDEQSATLIKSFQLAYDSATLPFSIVESKKIGISLRLIKS